METAEKDKEILRLVRICEDYAYICFEYERELKELRKKNGLSKEQDG